jgi:BirA family biotin operon repressor/biotin-[acetyl-CoA-carboxylase] ligase
VDPWLGTAAPARLKWPNDVLAASRKLAGILVETEDEAALLGIGLNLRQAPIEAASIAALAGTALAPADALPALLDRLGTWLALWETRGFEPVRTAWLARGPAPGTPVRVRAPGGTIAGAFAGLDADGALLLDGREGLRRVTAGEAWFEGEGRRPSAPPGPAAPDPGLGSNSI